MVSTVNVHPLEIKHSYFSWQYCVQLGHLMANRDWYVNCNGCRRPDTILSKENPLFSQEAKSMLSFTLLGFWMAKLHTTTSHKSKTSMWIGVCCGKILDKTMLLLQVKPLEIRIYNRWCRKCAHESMFQIFRLFLGTQKGLVCCCKMISGVREFEAALPQALLLTGQTADALDLLKGFHYCDVNICEEILPKGNHDDAKSDEAKGVHCQKFKPEMIIDYLKMTCDKERLKLEEEAECLIGKDDGSAEVLEKVYEHLEAMDASTAQKRAAEMVLALT
ncbi:Citron-like protein [Artemisia annua]|uniref:Citron-like protein n=1 Tax=Artemisia annua TaxID=35608 RepID=A0A2U1LBM6_ARTAN|nr:Citron-like protein [Artemisia annua]